MSTVDLDIHVMDPDDVSVRERAASPGCGISFGLGLKVWLSSEAEAELCRLLNVRMGQRTKIVRLPVQKHFKRVGDTAASLIADLGETIPTQSIGERGAPKADDSPGAA